MRKGIFILVAVMFLFSLTYVSAAQVTNIESGSGNGLQIFYPQYDYVKANSSFMLHVQVSNISNGLPLTNTQVDCRLHLYNSTGSHTFESPILTKDSNGWDHEIELNSNGGNFSDLGIHTFYIWCNASDIGGEAKGIFEVTPRGIEYTTPRALTYLGLLTLVIFLFIVIVIGITKLPEGKIRDEEGNLLGINNLKYLKPVLYMVAWAILASIFFLASNVALAYLHEVMFGTILLTIYQILMWSMIPAVLIWIIWIFIQVFQDKEMKNLIERGVPMGSNI